MGSATYAIAIVGWLVQFLVIYYIAVIIVEGNILPCLRDPYIGSGKNALTCVIISFLE